MAFPPWQTRSGLWRVRSRVQTNACLNFFLPIKKGSGFPFIHVQILWMWAYHYRNVYSFFFLIGQISIPCGWNQFFDWGNYWSLWPTMVLLDLLFLSLCIYHDSMWICLIFAFLLLWSQTNKYICNFFYNVKKKNNNFFL